MITHAELQNLLDYSPQTGLFTWRETRAHNAKQGSIAGWRATNGYLWITVNDQRYLAHRLAWFYVHGVWPDAEIDHVDHDRLNNRLENLRRATSEENRRNSGKRRNGKHKWRGIYFRSPNCWYARITVSGKVIRIGVFKDAADAAQAYNFAAVEHFGPFANLNCASQELSQ